MRTEEWTELPKGWFVKVLTTVAFVTMFIFSTACGKSPEVANLPCPIKDLISYTAVDLSDSARGSDVLTERLTLVEKILTETAVCSGTARVVAFTNSEAATVTLFSGDLKPKGATDEARRKHTPNLVDSVMAEVSRKLEAAKTSLPGGGTDVIAQLRLIHEFHQQVGDKRKLFGRILTDGISTTGVVINRPDLTTDLATKLAETVTVPTMPKSTTLIFAGIGKVSGPDMPPTEFTDAIKQFYTVLCDERLKAERCVPVSDLILGVKK